MAMNIQEDVIPQDTFQGSCIPTTNLNQVSKIKKIQKKKKIGVPKKNASRRRQRTTLSALIKNNSLLNGAKVYYCNGKKGPIMASGKISLDGVECCCCQNLFTLTKFEEHAGSTNHRPAANIFFENGMSLQDCQDQLKVKDTDLTVRVKSSEECGTDEKLSDTCGTHDSKISDRGTNGKEISGTPGDVLSDWSSNHNESSEICDVDGDIIPETYPNEQELLKVCDINDNICNICCEAGELVLCDQCPASFHLSCLGLTMVPHGNLWYCPHCCCRVCGRICIVTDEKSTELYTDNDTILKCDQCQKLYHMTCVKNDDFMDRCNTEEKRFCNEGCEKIYFGLQGFLCKQVKVEGRDNLTWTLLQNCDGIAPESCKKLKAALNVMHQCFKPSKEYRTKKDINEIIIFNKGAELNLEYLRGFYTVILERGGKVSTVAIVRVHGEIVAEMPLVATRFKYRRQGQCRILINEIQRKLAELGVKKLVLPSAERMFEMWSKCFGFCPMSEAERLNFLGFNFLNFYGTIMCQKSLRKSEDFEHHSNFETKI